MICRRCGQCCFHLDIFIVNPRSILADGTLDRSDPKTMIFKPARQMCPHLAWDGERALCTIHHLSCYKDTPCELFEQIGPEDAVCLMKGYLERLKRE